MRYRIIEKAGSRDSKDLYRGDNRAVVDGPFADAKED